MEQLFFDEDSCNTTFVKIIQAQKRLGKISEVFKLPHAARISKEKRTKTQRCCEMTDFELEWIYGILDYTFVW